MDGGSVTHTARTAAAYLALVAMIVHALIPAGWMPGQSAGTPLVICTAQGDITLHSPAKPQQPLDHSDRDHQLCPFAAAVHLAVAAGAIVLPAPTERILTSLPTQKRAPVATASSPYSSRAPPSPV